MTFQVRLYWLLIITSLTNFVLTHKTYDPYKYSHIKMKNRYLRGGSGGGGGSSGGGSGTGSGTGGGVSKSSGLLNAEYIKVT